jgi:hypothetical protein
VEKRAKHREILEASATEKSPIQPQATTTSHPVTTPQFSTEGSRIHHGSRRSQDKIQARCAEEVCPHITSIFTCSSKGDTNDYSRKAGPKPGARVIKPKKASLISQNKIKKKSAAGLVGQTEKLLAEKAGHLEMLKGGKKDKKEAKKTK